MDDKRIRNEVRDYYRAAALQDGPRGNDDRWGLAHYDPADVATAQPDAAGLSMGCGDPTTLAGLAPGEVVLDLGSGAGLDVLLAAGRVGPTGRAIGVDFLPEMVDRARANAAAAGVTNVEFLLGDIAEVPLPDASIDVVISNCVINLAPDKAPVVAEIARLLRPGGRMAVSDVVAEEGYRPGDDGGAWADCGAGALPRDEYRRLLAAAGLGSIDIEFTGETGPGLHAATLRAVRT